MKRRENNECFVTRKNTIMRKKDRVARIRVYGKNSFAKVKM